MYRLVAIVLLVWPAVARVYIDPTMVFNPDAPAEIVLDRDNYTQILVREATNVKLDCSFVRSTFIADNGIANDESVTIQWLFVGEMYFQPIIIQSYSHRVISGAFNETLNITEIRLATLAVDGLTGDYTCEVCHNRGMPSNGEICVNSTVPILGRRYPPDIQDGAHNDSCSEFSFFGYTITTCNVGTNYCIDNDLKRTRLTLLCAHNSTAPHTPTPVVGVWFINGVQITSHDGFTFPRVIDNIFITNQGNRLTITDDRASRGNYTCQLTNTAGMDTATTIITDCNNTNSNPKIDLQVILPQSTANITRLGAGRTARAVAIQSGWRVMLYCPSSGDETTSTRWFKRGSSTLQPVLPSTNHINLTTTKIQGVSTVILSIQGLREEDYGEYVCVAVNQAGRDKATIILTELGVWSTDEWSSCTRRRTVRCVGASGRQVATCSGDRPASISTCTNCQ